MSISSKPNCAYHAEAREEGALRLIEFVHLTRRHAHRSASGPHRLFWGLDYHFEDAGEFSLNGQAWQLREKGTVHLYAPGTAYWERSTARDLPFSETYITFNAQDVVGLNRVVEARHGFARFLDTAGTVRMLFLDLFEVAEGRAGSWQAQGALCCIVDRLLRAQTTDTEDYSLADVLPGPRSLSERVDAYISAHYPQRLTLDAMAQAMGVSRSTLTHRYRSETGTTPIARLCECRLAVARSMILRGERLKVVAAQTGFYDEYHLSKAFQRHFGRSPRNYVRETRRSC